MAEETKLSLDQLEFREIFADRDAHLSKFLSKHEGVHPIDPDGIIKTRLAPQPDSKNAAYKKHCLGLFIPEKEEPQVVVYIRFMNRKTIDNVVPNGNLTGNINLMLNEPSELLDKSRGEPNTAIFFTISLMATDVTKFEKGKEASGPGEKLLHHVAQHLYDKYNLDVYTTLSPMRDFGKWLKTASDKESEKPILTNNEKNKLTIIMERAGQKHNNAHDTIAYLHNNPMKMDAEERDFFSNMMRDLGSHYIINEKSSRTTKEGKLLFTALDTTANFHQKNGAEFANIHHKFAPGTMGDSAKETTLLDSAQAFGLMANYRYERLELKVKKDSYILTGEVNADPILKNKNTARLIELNPVKATKITITQDLLKSVPPSPVGRSWPGFAI